MNEMNVLYAFGEIEDKYILEAEKTGKRKSGKRIVTILIAAAMLLVGTVGAGAYYLNDEKVHNGMKWRFLGASDDSDTSALDGITSHKGKMTENTFDGLDISFSGAVCDEDDLFVIFTVSKTDGTAFTQPDGYAWRVGYTELSYDGIGSGFLGDHVEDHNFHTMLNEDGTLSVTITGDRIYQPGFKLYDYKFAFTDLYCAPLDCYYDSSDHSRELSDIYKLGVEMSGKYESKDQSGFEEAKTRFFSELNGVSVESYEGRAECTADSAPLKADIPSYEFEYNELPVNMDITPIKIRIYASGQGWDPTEYRRYKEQPLEIVYKDGTSDILECEEYSYGGNINDSMWELRYPGKKPIKVSQIEYVVFDGVTVYPE